MARVALHPGESRKVRIVLSDAEFAMIGADLQPRLEAGEFRIYVGSSADRSRLLETVVHLQAAEG